MCGSSASNEYGSGGTENATGLSSSLRLGSKLFVVVLACKRSATALVPNNPALTTLPRNRNLRRFIVAPLLRFVRQRRWDYTAVARGNVNRREPRACDIPALILPHARTTFHLHYTSLDARQSPLGRFGNHRIV